MPKPPRTRWRSARSHLTPVAEGGKLIAGAPETTFRTAPLPPGVPLKLWEECECDYVSGPRKTDPAWTMWTEDPPREAGREAGKQCLRYALSDPRRRSDGGLLGPNYYALGHFHSGDARHDAPGYPDLTIWTPLPIDNEVWELKRMGENPTLPQAHHMTSLEASGLKVRTVRPCCLLSGAVDRWLGRLADREPTLSQWAPELTAEDREAARRRAARAAIAAGGPVAQLPGAAPRPPALSVVPDPPGQPVPDELPVDAPEATAYLIPMPGGDNDVARRELEGWLRDAGFPAVTVPWPMRIAVSGRLVVVWVNTGGPAVAGQPRPRCWRTAYQDDPFPEAAAIALGARGQRAATLPAAMALIKADTPAPHLPEETR